MYNVVITVPKTEQDGELQQNANYKEIVIKVLGTPAISHSFASNSLSNIIHVKREVADAADIIALLSEYTDVTITVSEVVEEVI